MMSSKHDADNGFAVGITGPLNGTTPGSPGIGVIPVAAVETGQGRRCAVRLACLPLPDSKHAYAMAAS
jgi:hypothetical protein